MDVLFSLDFKKSYSYFLPNELTTTRLVPIISIANTGLFVVKIFLLRKTPTPGIYCHSNISPFLSLVIKSL